MIVLSSFERLKRILCVDDSPKNRAALTSYLYAVSEQIQSYINIDLELSEKIEDFNIHRKEIEFWVKSIPITSIRKIEHDFDGLFDGSESELTDFYIGRGKRSVVLDFPETKGKRVLRVTYTGGVATTAAISTYTLTSITGTFLAGSFVKGSLSGAVGLINSFSTSTLNVEVLYGVFRVGDVLTMQTAEGGSDVAGVGGTINTIDTQALVEARPDIALACETQIAYNVRTRENFEVTDIDENETSRRDTQTELTYRGTYNDLQPEVRSLLNKHRRYIMQ